MTEILIATFNSKKRLELKALLKELKDVKVIGMEDMKACPPMIVEDGDTFRQNAVKKAVVVSRFFDGLVIADDSGLEVDALFGKPGVRSARFARKNATDKENNKKLLNLIEKSLYKKRSARFICHIALAKKGELLDDFEGTAKGRIGFKPKGKNGFGYDPLFLPDKHEKTFAEMPQDYKNKISHRAAALKKLKRSIRKFL